MPSDSKTRKPSVNAREARREAALAQILGGMSGAFGDYIRSRMAQGMGQPMPPPMPMGQGMGAGVPMGAGAPGAAAPAQPVVSQLQGPNGLPIISLPEGSLPAAPTMDRGWQIWNQGIPLDPGFASVPPPAMPVMPDPGFAAVNPAFTVADPNAILAALAGLGAGGAGGGLIGGGMLPPTRRV